MKHSAPLFSVVIPTFNREEIVLKAIQSVLDQHEKDFEIIVVDNGSTDNTKENIKALINEKIKYIYRKPSGGPAWPRNLGIESAQGEWICFLDSDDVWFPTKLAEIKQHIKTQESTAYIHWQTETDIDGENITVRKADPVTLTNYQKMLTTENTIVTSTVCVNRLFVNQYNIRFKEDEDYIAVEDYDFWLQILFNGGRYHSISKILGEMRTVCERTGTEEIFWEKLPFLYQHHVNEVQTFTTNKRALLRKLEAGMSLRRGFSLLRNGYFRSALHFLFDSMRKNPIEIIKYLGFRLRQRFQEA